jgi:hypothetical protein
MKAKSEIENAIEAIKKQQANAGKRGNQLNPNVLTRLGQRRRALEHSNGCGGCEHMSVTVAPAFTVSKRVNHVTLNCEVGESPLTVGEELLFNENYRCPGWIQKTV